MARISSHFILCVQDNAQSYFIPRDDSNSPVDPATIAILRKLLKLVQQRDIVMAMPEGEQLRVYGTVITMLDILANETCELVSILAPLRSPCM